MEVINLTPHNVDICDEDGNIIKTYEASGQIARLAQRAEVIEYIDGIPVKVSRDRRITGLPMPHKGVTYIVSNIILNACRDRMDLIAPATKFYDGNRLVGCTSFMSNR